MLIPGRIGCEMKSPGVFAGEALMRTDIHSLGEDLFLVTSISYLKLASGLQSGTSP